MTSKKLPACVRRSSSSPLFLSSNFVIRFWSEEVCALAARLAKTRIEQKSPYRIQRSFISASWGREASSARNGLHFKLIVLSVLVQSPACLRSEGPSVSSPVREGGVATTISSLSAEGAPRFVPVLWTSGLLRGWNSPPSRTGLCAPESASGRRGESPLQANALRPVTDCNCVAARRGGEQQEVNDQSVG